MAFVLSDRVKETTTTTGTGAVTLGGAVTGFEAFSARMSNGDTTRYCITDGTAWEVGVGTWNTGGTLSRTTVIKSSNSDSAVSFSAGTKSVFMTWDSAYRPKGSCVQEVTTITGAVATGTTTMVSDDTIPQNTEGDQYMSLSITPKSSSNVLIIEVLAYLSTSNTQTRIIGAIFQDSTSNALAAGETYNGGLADIINDFPLKHIMTAGTTSSTTFKFRAGTSGAGTTTFNGNSGGRKYGGVSASSIIIREYQV